MKKKISLLTLSLFLITQFSFARLYYYCAANGISCLVVVDYNNNIVSTVCNGTCYGGPYGGWVNASFSPQEGNSSPISEVSDNVYNMLNTYSIYQVNNTGENFNEANSLFSDSTSLYAINQLPQQWINPDKINFSISKTLAVSEGKSIYALTMGNYPFNTAAHFDIWSTVNQPVDCYINDLNSGTTLYQTSVALTEGKNTNVNVTIPAVIQDGNYLMVLRTSVNQIKSKIVVVHKQ